MNDFERCIKERYLLKIKTTNEMIEKYFESINDYSCAERVKFAVEKTLEILGEE